MLRTPILDQITYVIAFLPTPFVYLTLLTISFGVLILRFRDVDPPAIRLSVSFWTCVAQVAAAWLSNALTLQDAISKSSCKIGIFGLYATFTYMFVDTASLASLLIERQRTGKGGKHHSLAAFIVIRLLTHVLLLAAFVWSALRCTV